MKTAKTIFFFELFAELQASLNNILFVESADNDYDCARLQYGAPTSSTTMPTFKQRLMSRLPTI